MINTLTRGATDRLISLDVFRGITIAGMVLVNNPGSWGHIYWRWHMRSGTAGHLIYSGLFAWWAPPKVASLAFAIAFSLLWLGLMWILYRRKIFIKV